jgi:hypothetical protein
MQRANGLLADATGASGDKCGPPFEPERFSILNGIVRPGELPILTAGRRALEPK